MDFDENNESDYGYYQLQHKECLHQTLHQVVVNRPGQENNDRDEDDEDDEDDGNGNVDSWIPTGETISVMLIGFSRTSTAMSFVSAVLEYSGWMKILKS